MSGATRSGERPWPEDDGPRGGESQKGNGGDAPRLVFTGAEFLSTFVPPDYLVEGLLQRRFLYSLTGMTGSGKTAIGTLLATTVSYRLRKEEAPRRFGPHLVEHGRVCYIAAENPLDVQMRNMATLHLLDRKIEDFDLLFIGNIFDLNKDYTRIERDIRDFGGIDLALVDTSAATFIGDDENNNIQMLAHAKRLRRLTELPGKPCVVALCHPPKLVTSREHLLPRGGGAFLNEMDGNLTAWQHDGNLTDLHWTGKFRGPDFTPLTFRTDVRYVPDLVDTKGKPLPTVTASFVTPEQADETHTRMLSQEDKLLTVMKEQPKGSLTAWATACCLFIRGDITKPNKQHVERLLRNMKTDKLVEKDGRGWKLTKIGKQAISSKEKTDGQVDGDGDA
jgi:hypothetical protein